MEHFFIKTNMYKEYTKVLLFLNYADIPPYKVPGLNHGTKLLKITKIFATITHMSHKIFRLVK